MRGFLFGSIAAAMLALAVPASGTILFAGGEDIDFSCVAGSCSVSTGGNPFRTAWARAAYAATGAAADPTTNRFSTSTWSGVASLWVHGQYCNNNGGCGANGSTNATTSNSQMIRVFDDAGNPTLIVRGTGTAGQLKISSRTSGGVFTDLVTCSSAFDNALSQIDLFIDYGVAGTVTLYKNSSQTCTYTGDVTNGDGATTLTKVELSGTTTQSGAWSEIIAATTSTTAKNLLTIKPNGNGNAVQWTGTNPCTAILNATTVNDASFVQSSTNDQLEQCTVNFGNNNASLPAGTYRVDTFVMSARLLRGATGPQTFDFVTRTASTDYTSTDTALTTSFANYQYFQTTNPNTLAAWGPTDFSAAGFNIGLKSRP